MRGSSRKNHARIIKKDLGWQQYVQTQLDDINDELLLLYEKSTAYASKPDDPPKMRLVEATENGTGNKVVMVRLLANFKFSCDTLTESDKKFINEAVQNLRDLLSNEGEFDLESDGCQIIKPIRWVISSFYVLLSAPVVVLDRLYKSLQEERESDSLLQFDIADVYPAFRVTTSDVAASLSRTLARLALRQEALAIKARSSLGQGEAELTFKVRLDTTDKHAESSLLHFVSAEQRRTIAADKELEITDLAALRLVALNGKPRFGATEGHKNITPSANVFDTPKFRRSCEARGWSLDKGKNHVCSKWNTFNGGDGLAFPCDKHGSFVQNLSQERLWDPAKWLEESAPKSLKQEVKAAQTATPVTSGKKEKRKKNKTAAAAGPAIAQAWLDHRKSWRSTDQKGLDHSKLFAVSPKSAEFNGVATEFARTLPYCTIDQLDRVENGYAQEAFELNCATIERQVSCRAAEWKCRMLQLCPFLYM